MDHLKILTALLCVTVVATLGISTEGNCGSLDTGVKERLDKVLNELPDEYVDASSEGKETTLPKLVLGKMSLTGLSRLQVNSPYEVFCREDLKIILFTLSSRAPLRFRLPWSLCNAQNGTLTSAAGHVQYEGEIIVSGNRSSDVTLNRFTPVVTESIETYLYPFDPAVNFAVTILSQVLAGPVRLFWVDVMSLQVKDAIRAALSYTE